jgi:predicted nucleic acid-binding protein
MGSLDTMIAAHGLARGFVLVTSDLGFARIKTLKVEDWTQ